MSQITGGTVRFLKRKQEAQFEPAEAEVSIAFSVGEGDDHVGVLNLAGHTAQSKVCELLGLPYEPLEPANDAGSAAPAASNAAPASNGSGRGRGRPPGTGRLQKLAAAAEPQQTQAASDDLTAMPGDDKVITLPDQSQPAEDDVLAGLGDDDPLAAAATEITDKDLVDAITKHNGVTKATQAIRQLIGKYVAPPKQARDIPQEKRSAFLAELSQIKAAAA